MSKPPVSEQVQVNFRMPADLRDRIKAKAESNGRSMNAEIISALELYFPAPKGPKDVVEEVISVLSYVEPSIREEAIKMLEQQAANGELSTWATAYAYADRDSAYRFPWED